jgi:hypothetical protein
MLGIACKMRNKIYSPKTIHKKLHLVQTDISRFSAISHWNCNDILLRRRACTNFRIKEVTYFQSEVNGKAQFET